MLVRSYRETSLTLVYTPTHTREHPAMHHNLSATSKLILCTPLAIMAVYLCCAISARLPL